MEESLGGPTTGDLGKAARKSHTPIGVEVTARQKAIEEIANLKVASTENYLDNAGEDIYGEYVFGEAAQRQFLAKPVLKKLRKTIEVNPAKPKYILTELWVGYRFAW